MSVPHPFHEFPKHLYADGPKVDSATGKEYPSAVYAQNGKEEAIFRTLGYGDSYVPLTYPMALHKKVAGQVVSVAARNAAEAKEFQQKGWVTADKV